MSEILKFEPEKLNLQTRGLPPSPLTLSIPVVPEELNPYGQDAPKDMEEMLLPDGTKFGLFNDPYAQQVFIKPNEGIRNGQYWFSEKSAGGNFSEKEIQLLDLLSTIRIATRSQIHRALHRGDVPENDRSTVDFIKRCRKNGIICAFSWISPLNDERKKPRVYALTKAGAMAAELLFQRKLPDKFWLQPISFPVGRNPSMDVFFLDLIANELYSELVRIDRLVDWTRRPPIKLPNAQSNHYPYASFKVIKEENDFKSFWVEVFRPTKDWLNKAITRFQRTEIAFNSLPENQQPYRLIIIVDGDSRVKFLSELANKYMPSVTARFTTDERLLMGIGDDTFIAYNFDKQELVRKSIPYLKPGFHGMTATEYYATIQVDFDDDDDV